MSIKKIYLLLLTILLLGVFTPALAETDPYKLYCPSGEPKIANTFFRGVQKATGLNLVAKKVAEKEIKKTLAQFVKGDVAVNVQSFSATDAKNGVFKSFNIYGQNLNIYSVYISEFLARTKCNFIHLNLESNPVSLIEPMAIDFDVKFSQNDLNKILKSDIYKKYFFSVKLNNKQLSLLEISSPKISLANNKFHFMVNIKLPLIQMLTLSFKSDLKIVNNKIITDNTSVGCNNKNVDISEIKYAINLLNPFTVVEWILAQNNCKILLKSVKIYNEKIIIDGSLFIDKN